MESDVLLDQDHDFLQRAHGFRPFLHVPGFEGEIVHRKLRGDANDLTMTVLIIVEEKSSLLITMLP